MSLVDLLLGQELDNIGFVIVALKELTLRDYCTMIQSLLDKIQGYKHKSKLSFARDLVGSDGEKER